MDGDDRAVGVGGANSACGMDKELGEAKLGLARWITLVGSSGGKLSSSTSQDWGDLKR